MASTAEYLDIVNEADEVIGRDTRDNVHARHEIHRGVHVFVTNSKGEPLLQKRSLEVSYYPGYWDASVGGQVASGETYLDAATRELAEELGCRSCSLELIGKYNSYSERQREKRALFLCENDGPFHPAGAEIAALEFVAPDAVGAPDERRRYTVGFMRSLDLWRDWLERDRP